jgi:hypothetical protein
MDQVLRLNLSIFPLKDTIAIQPMGRYSREIWDAMPRRLRKFGRFKDRQKLIEYLVTVGKHQADSAKGNCQTIELFVDYERELITFFHI